MPAFDIVVVGSGGGLDETNLSAYVPSVPSSYYVSNFLARGHTDIWSNRAINRGTMASWHLKQVRPHPTRF